jgi:hypothetical protein
MQLVKKYYVGSETDKAKKYLVELFDDGSATCECEFFKFKGYKGFGSCKHIKRSLEHLNAEKNKEQTQSNL